MDFIAELELAQDMLAIKSLVDGVKLSFVATPTPEKGDFVDKRDGSFYLVLPVFVRFIGI